MRVHLPIRRVLAVLLWGALAASGLPTAAQTSTHVTFIQPLVCFCAAPIYAAADLGYFKDEGLDVDIGTVEGSGPMFAAIESGSAQFALTNGLTLLTSVPKGLGLVAFVGMDKGQGGFNMVVSNAWAQAHGIKANGDWQDALRKLGGARVAVLATAATGGRILAAYAKQAGLPPDAMSVISMTPAASNAALRNGEIDAWWQTAPAVGGVLAFRSADLPKISGVIGNVIFTTRDEIAKNPAVVAKMARAIARGDNALLDVRTQDRALQAVYDRMPNLPRDEIRAEVLTTETQSRVRNGEITTNAFKLTNEIDAELGLLDRALTPEQLRSVYTLDFVPKRYLAP